MGTGKEVEMTDLILSILMVIAMAVGFLIGSGYIKFRKRD